MSCRSDAQGLTLAKLDTTPPLDSMLLNFYNILSLLGTFVIPSVRTSFETLFFKQEERLVLKKLITCLAILGSSVCFFLILALIFLNATQISCTRQRNRTFTCHTQTSLPGQFPLFSRDVTHIVDVDHNRRGYLAGLHGELR